MSSAAHPALRLLQVRAASLAHALTAAPPAVAYAAAIRFAAQLPPPELTVETILAHPERYPYRQALTVVAREAGFANWAAVRQANGFLPGGIAAATIVPASPVCATPSATGLDPDLTYRTTGLHQGGPIAGGRVRCPGVNGRGEVVEQDLPMGMALTLDELATISTADLARFRLQADSPVALAIDLGPLPSFLPLAPVAWTATLSEVRPKPPVQRPQCQAIITLDLLPSAAASVSSSFVATLRAALAAAHTRGLLARPPHETVARGALVSVTVQTASSVADPIAHVTALQEVLLGALVSALEAYRVAPKP